MSNAAAFFDLDGTLTSAHIYSSIVRRRMRHPVGALRAVAYLLYHFALVIPYRLELLEPTRFFMSWMVDLADLIKGMRRSEAAPLFRAVADDIMAGVRPDVMALLREHQAQGRLTFIVSGAFQPILQEVGRRMNAEYVIGTPLEESDGRYTGRLPAPACFGPEKARQVRGFIERMGLDVDLASSYAYADRYHDIPLLEMVGHPVATYPDEGLLAYARERGWRVQGAVSA